MQIFLNKPWNASSTDKVSLTHRTDNVINCENQETKSRDNRRMSELKKLFHITPASETSCAGWFGIHVGWVMMSTYQPIHCVENKMKHTHIVALL